jgi:hypothetical protein
MTLAVVRKAPMMWMDAILCAFASFAAAPTDPTNLRPCSLLLTIGVSQTLAAYSIARTAAAVYSCHDRWPLIPFTDLDIHLVCVIQNLPLAAA